MATNQPRDNLNPKMQQELLNNLTVGGNLSTGDMHQTINNYFSSQPPHQQELTIDWMRQHFKEIQDFAGARYTPKIHVELPEAWVFEGLGRTDAFFDRIENLYGQLCRKWNKAKPSETLHQRIPEIAQRLESLGQSVSVLATALKQIDRNEFLPIDFSNIATLAQEIKEKGYNCYRVAWETESPPDEERTETAEAKENNRSRRELLDSVRHHISQVREVVREIKELATSHSSETANKGALLLLGNAGTGKTHLFCDVAQRRLDKFLPTVILLGQHFNQGEPWTQMMQRLHLSFRDRNEFLDALDVAAQACGRRALILIDALNEGDGKRLWRDELSGILSVLQNYPRIGLAVSCRTSYERVIIPDGLTPDKLVKVKHRGFENHEYIATKTFFDHYGIERPNVPLLVPEFSNPLFLKIFCEGLFKRQLTRIPTGLKGITAIFNFFIDAVHETLWRRLDYDKKTNLVRQAVDKLAAYMAQTGESWVEREQAKRIVNEVLPATGYQQTLFANLLSEGLLAEDMVYPPSEQGSSEFQSIDTVKFPYEKFSDHIIVRYLLNTHLDRANPVASFNTNQLIGRLLAQEWEAWRNSGWIEALSVQLPEQTGCELVELSPQVKTWDVVQRAFLQSIIWRDPTKVTEATKDYLNEIFREQDGAEAVYDLLLTVATVPEHPFNAKLLHCHLMSLEMPERDELWSIYLSYQYEQRGAVDRLLEWAWEAEKTHISDEAIELCAIALAWFLTTSHRFVRDRATKALVAMLHPRPHVLVEVIEQFLDVNDVYILERLYAVAYGVAMLSNEAEGVGTLASKVYEWVFEAGTPPVHILLRDYARGVIEAAAHRGILPTHVDIERTRPPYQSAWPLEIPTEEELKSYGKTSENMDDREWARSDLYDSVMGFGDFTRYVIGTNNGDFEWSSRRSDEPTTKQKYEEFIESLTERQRKVLEQYKIVRSNISFCKRLDAATQREHFDGEISNEELDSILASEEKKFLRTVGNNKRKIFHEFVLPHLEDPKGKEFQFDLSIAQRWILKRVFDLGWTVERFGNFDRRINYNDIRSANKPERVGKKYQWIAYHEFLAHVADNLEFVGDVGLDDSPQSYEGPWQISSETRDIDPSLLLRRLPKRDRTNKTTSWWQLVQYTFNEADKQEQIAWIAQEDDCPDPRQLIEVTRPNDGTVWLTLEGHYRWIEQGPIEEDQYDSLRRDMWFQVRSYIVHREYASELLQWLNIQNFMGRWMPESESMFDVFLGEFPWAASYKDKNETKDWVQPSRRRDDLPSVVVTTTEYLREDGTFDCSIDDTISALIPSAWLIRNMGLRWSGGRFSFVDSTNEVVAFNPSAEEVGPYTVLISPEKLTRFLSENNFEIIWTVLGERQLIGGHHREWHGRLELSGVYQLCNGIVQGEPLKAWYKTPQ
ncbi:AVAST type 2 anti-phage system protein Avs2 [Coleofasciculus sp. E1-EBD-02]|uniref:AVAST type 2 anti-phage system protein Avs2 n=1 Tax=Coleofasciculus sp. E1-EBD-02 TaxID=3068481 RepID=UPI0033015C1A